MPRLLPILLILLACRSISAAGPDFTREVRPILSQLCFKCHGMDDQARQSGLRLDRREAALAPAESGSRAIVPGKPAASELVRRILAEDAEERMPPASTKTSLTAAQKQTLRDWIAAGGEYAPHWAFVAPRPQTLPPVTKHAAATRNAIDRFILARLERENLAPSPEADRLTLARRVYLDLIGVPPTPAEADAFARDDSPDAYERLVDRLLASPQYGERWARRWLDLARYADTNGYEKDRPRSIWPYRDWVIRALDADLSFDQFTLRQIAGDMLPAPTADDLVATGFHRNTMLNEEGGIDPNEFRFYALTDRVSTTGTAWLGLTIGCAQCHTHKFDPITHTEYYGFMGLMNNADEPDYEIVSPGLAEQRADAARRAEELIAAAPSRFAVPEGQSAAAEERAKAFEAALADWTAKESAAAVNWSVLRPASLKSNLPILTTLDDGSVLASGDQTKSDTYDLTYRVSQRGATALRIEALPHDSLPADGPGRTYYEGTKGDFFLAELTVTQGGKPLSFAEAKAASPSNPKAVVDVKNTLDGNATTGWSGGGKTGEPIVAIYRLQEPADLDGELAVKMFFERHFSCGLGRFRVSVTSDSRQIAPPAHPAEVEAALARPAGERSDADRAAIRRRFIETAPQFAALQQELKRLRDSRGSGPATLVLQERPPNQGRTQHRYHRGEFLQPKEAVAPGVPAFVASGSKPTTRLDLARWLVSPANPLTARVTVNRHWQAFFGRGLVRTLEDFGYQGDAPSHPELLDWLALEFMRQGWSLKRLHRLIVTSGTYRQSSRVSAELTLRDPQNVLLARGARFRLEAEIIRDSTLAAAGLLSAKKYGPGVFPPQPPSITTEGAYRAFPWNVSPGEDRYRRTLYTFQRRSTPFEMLLTFDGGSGEACLARRDVSNSPLQALTLLNDAMFLEASQALGRDLAALPGDDAEKAAHLFRRCLTRPPNPDESSRVLTFLRQQQERLKAQPAEAAKLAGPGPGDPISRAAWTALARALLNLDEAVTRN